MKKIKQLIDKIEESNLSFEDKKLLTDILKSKNKDWQKFLWEFLKVMGVGKRVFDLFNIDVKDIIDKFL